LTRFRTAFERILEHMLDRTFLVHLRPPSCAIQQVNAVRFEVHGEHLVFFDSKVVRSFLVGDCGKLERDRFLSTVRFPSGG
jgi:hypothetical protein